MVRERIWIVSQINDLRSYFCLVLGTLRSRRFLFVSELQFYLLSASYVRVVATFFFFLNDPAPPEFYPLSLHDALPILCSLSLWRGRNYFHLRRFFFFFFFLDGPAGKPAIIGSPLPKSMFGIPVMRRIILPPSPPPPRSEEHTSELQSPCNLVCRLLLEK